MHFFFLVKKWVAPLFFPLPLCILLALSGFFLLAHRPRWKKTGSLLLSSGLFFLILFSNAWVGNLLVGALEAPFPPFSTLDPALQGRVKYIVVLASSHQEDFTQPPAMRLSPDALQRLVEAVRLHRLLPETILLFSGGPPFASTPEAQILKEAAVSLGVNPERIELESLSRDTADEARYLGPVLGDNPFFLVTSTSHMLRSVRLFEQQGMHPIPAPAGRLAVSREIFTPDDFYPAVHNLVKSQRAVYEYLGLIWARLRGQISRFF